LTAVNDAMGGLAPQWRHGSGIGETSSGDG
jgi:hypothetical protein